MSKDLLSKATPSPSSQLQVLIARWGPLYIVEAVNSYNRNQAALKAAVELAEATLTCSAGLYRQVAAAEGRAEELEKAHGIAREVLRLAGKE